MTDRTNNYGYAHISLSVGSKGKVDELAKLLIDDGHPFLTVQKPPERDITRAPYSIQKATL